MEFMYRDVKRRCNLNVKLCNNQNKVLAGKVVYISAVNDVV